MPYTPRSADEKWPTFDLELGSAADPNAYVDAVGFGEALSAHIKALRQTAEFYSPSQNVEIRYELVDLNLNSPPVAKVRGIIHNGPIRVLEEAESRFAALVEKVESGAPIPPEEYPIMRAVKAVGDTNRKYHLRSRMFSSRLREPLTMTRRLGDRLGIFLSQELKVNGSVEGYLRYINLHRQNTMRIHAEAELGIPYVTCRFPKSLEEKAAAAVRKYVVVYGEKIFRPDARHPYFIAATDIQVVERPESFPSYAETAGIARDFIGGMSTDDIIREVRSGW